MPTWRTQRSWQPSCTDCLSQEQSEGTIDGYALRYLRQDNGLFQKIAFVDTSMQQATLQEMMSSHIQIGRRHACCCWACPFSFPLGLLGHRPVERPGGSSANSSRTPPMSSKPPDRHPLQCGAAGGRPASGTPARWGENIRMEAQRMKNLVEEMLTLAGQTMPCARGA